MLSGGAAGLHAREHEQPGVVASSIIPVIARPFQLSGMATGNYSARTIPDAGKFYTFTQGSGTIKPLGMINVVGKVSLPGLLIMPIGLGGGPSSVKATGQLTLATAPGTSAAQALPALWSRTPVSPTTQAFWAPLPGTPRNADWVRVPLAGSAAQALPV